MRDKIEGSVYVEAPTMIDVRHALSGIPGVRRNRHGLLRVDCVSIDDRISILKMSDRTSIRHGRWVRIRKPGLYHNDVGFVLDFDPLSMDAQIALVPRIRLTQKRHQRPDAALFNLEAVKLFYGHHSVKQCNQVFLFRKGIYKNGLLEQSFGWHEISDHPVNPAPSELTLFTQCADRVVVLLAALQMRTMRVDDRITVVAGSLKGIRGHLADINERGTASIRPAAPSTVPAQAVREWDVRKMYQLGDCVRVISGEEEGAEGYIVDMQDDNVTLYCSLPEQSFSDGGGREVHL
jgi:ribosomal protein L24